MWISSFLEIPLPLRGFPLVKGDKYDDIKSFLEIPAGAFSFS